MNLWRWFGTSLFLVGLLTLAGLTLPALAQEKDKDKDKAKAGGKGTELKWTAFDKAKEFYQETTTNTKQDMTVMGMDITQDQSQTFYMEWKPEKDKDKDGNWVVVQKIIGVKMTINIGGNKIAYDSTSETQPNNPLSDFFKAVKEAKFTYTISPKDMKVTKIDGRDEFVKKLSQTNPQMESFLKSILSEEAMKSMAQQTWFALPPSPKEKGETWPQKDQLKLGPVGTYDISMTFKYVGPKDKNEVIDLEKATMTYSPPTAKDGLPFTIKEKSTLEAKESSGQFIFSPDKGRWDTTTMKMKLEGTLNIEVGGMETSVVLKQTQESTSKFTDDNPIDPKKKATK